jgi:hypothetical protein
LIQVAGMSAGFNYLNIILVKVSHSYIVYLAGCFLDIRINKKSVYEYVV